MQLASSSLTVMVSGNANPHRTDADHLRRSHDILFSSASVCTGSTGFAMCHGAWGTLGPPGAQAESLMHMIGDDDDGDRDRDATMMAEHDGELMMAMTVALT